MDLFSKKDFEELLNMQAAMDVSSRCVSIYLPTHRFGPQIEQDRIRLKNLLRNAQDQLAELGIRPAEMSDLLGSAQGLVEQSLFWQYQSEGLCLFLAPGFCRYFRLPQNFSEVIVIEKKFHLKPLIQFLSEGNRFFLLKITKDTATFYLGSQTGLDEVEVPRMPRKLSDVVPETELNSSLQSRSAGGTSGIFHGQVDDDWDKKQTLKFYREVEKALSQRLKVEKAPLLLCGPDMALHLYQSVDSYKHTLETPLSGNFLKETSEEVFKRAYPLVSPVFTQQLDKAVDQYKQLAGTGKTTRDLEEALVAAKSGRVDTLFVSLSGYQWGRLDVEHNQVLRVRIEDTDHAANEDLVDRCAREGYLNGAKVFAVRQDRMPEDSMVAAILRY
jgi:hypothetical protein